MLLYIILHINTITFEFLLLRTLILKTHNLQCSVYVTDMYTQKSTIFSVFDELKNKLNKKTKKFENIFPLIYSMNNLFKAYYKIKSNPGNIIFMNDDKKFILNLMDNKWLKKTSKQLETGTYEFREARKVYTLKADAQPLIIRSPSDKIIQQAFLQILQPIFEGIFH